jgi:hypothetical protein
MLDGLSAKMRVSSQLCMRSASSGEWDSQYSIGVAFLKNSLRMAFIKGSSELSPLANCRLFLIGAWVVLFSLVLPRCETHMALGVHLNNCGM